MKLILGCIADDITGATDLALMLGRSGMPVMQYIGLPGRDSPPPDIAAAVIALKSRTAPLPDAVRESIAAVRWLRKQGARQFFFKYCSTFDSTDEGNIGPVAEALQEEIGAGIAPVCPAFPANGRTVYMGHLFVGEQLLSESSMRHHPLTPMTDANLLRILGRQVCSMESVGLVPLPVVEEGAQAVRDRLEQLKTDGKRLPVTDALTDVHLRTLGEACRDYPLITGGSGIAMGLPENYRKKGLLAEDQGLIAVAGEAGPAAVLAGSCSAATQRQVDRMSRHHAAMGIEPLEIEVGRQKIEQIIDWAADAMKKGPVLIYSTESPEEVARVQNLLGRERAGTLVEETLAAVAVELRARGLKKLIIAGGETAGAVLNALGVRTIRIGPEIEPGVPWTVSVDPPRLLLALKSGNFGSDRFFEKALEMVS